MKQVCLGYREHSKAVLHALMTEQLSSMHVNQRWGLQLKLGYSIHRELSVRCNGERSWDYTTPSTGRQPGAPMSLAPPPGFGPGPGPQGNFGTPQGGYGGPRPQGNMGPSPRPQPRWNEIPNMDCTGAVLPSCHDPGLCSSPSLSDLALLTSWPCGVGAQATMATFCCCLAAW